MGDGRTGEESFEQVAARLRAGLEGTNDARELALKASREIIRCSSRAIRAVHRLQFSEAERLLAETRGLVDQVKAGLAGHPGLFYAGYVHDSQRPWTTVSN